MANKRLNTNNNFEQRLQNDAENYCMYPSDKVWDNIRVELHGKPKWPALLITFTSIVIALIIATVLNYPPHHLLVKYTTSISPQKIAITQQKNKHYIAVKTKINPEKNQQTIQEIPEFISLVNGLPKFDIVDERKNIETHELLKNITTAVNNNSEEKGRLIELGVLNLTSKNNISEENNSEPNAVIISNTDEIDNTSTIKINKQNNGLTKNIDAENYLNRFKNSTTNKQYKKSKWQVQYYAAITNSYRTLEDDKSRLSYISNPIERQALKANVNDVVKHKPAMGGEFGVSFLYGLTKKFYVKSGLQFNIRQYGIDAYRAEGNATFSYVQNNQLNSFSVKSVYSTQESAYKEKLQDKLYQISIPIGFQWDVVDGERWGLSTAATIQPTMTLNKNVYIVSTDYKYYADGTDFFRRFNINTSAELYLTLKSKESKWFFGPQIRYQQMPTYNDIYPIKEYRVDYGIKFGFIKSLR